MAMQKEQGTCFGRGFADVDTDGWLAKFKEWIVKPIGSGGPGWVMLRDASTYPISKTITAIDTVGDTVTITGHGYKTGDYVLYQSTGTAIGGLVNGNSYIITAVDPDTIKFSLNSGFNPQDVQKGTYTNLSSLGSGTHTLIARGPFIIVAESTPSGPNDPKKILQVGYTIDVPGYVQVRALYAWDATEGNGLFYWGGQRIKTVDAGYFVYDFRGGNEFLCLQSYIASEPNWYSVMIDNWTALTNFTEPPTVRGTIQTALTCSSSDAQTIQMTDSAEASLFTKNNWYFVYDFRDYCVRATYCQCVGVGVADGLNADEIQLNYTRALNYVSTKTGDTDNVLNVGSIICAYDHRYVFFGNGSSESLVESIQLYKSVIPYVDYNYYYQAYVIFRNTNYIRSAVFCSKDTLALYKADPLDNGSYAVQKPLVVSYYNFSINSQNGMSGVWGELDNAYLTSEAGMTKMQTGRIIDEGSGDEEWISLGAEDDSIFLGDDSLHLLIPNTESV